MQVCMNKSLATYISQGGILCLSGITMYCMHCYVMIVLMEDIDLLQHFINVT